MMRQTGAAIALSRPTMPALLCLGMLWGAFGAQVPALKAGLGAGDGAFGVALMFAAAGAMAAMAFVTRFEARARALALPVAAVALALAFQLIGAAPSLVVFAAAIALCGACSGLLDVTASGRIATLEARHRTTLMSLNHGMFSFAYAASAMTAGLAREAGVAPSLVFGVLGLLVCLLALGMRMEPEQAASDQATPASAAGTGLGLVVFGAGLVVLAALLAESATESWSALHIERTLGGRAAEGALGPALMGLTMGIGRIAGHFLTRQRREEVVVTVAALVAAAGVVLAAAAPTPPVAYLGFAVLGFGISVIVPLVFALVGRLAGPGARARAIGRVAIIGYMAFLIGPPALGLLSEAFGLRMAFAAVAAAIALAPLALLLLRRAPPAA